jgi:hypothetical protein
MRRRLADVVVVAGLNGELALLVGVAESGVDLVRAIGRGGPIGGVAEVVRCGE